jgi:ribonuclease E
MNPAKRKWLARLEKAKTVQGPVNVKTLAEAAPVLKVEEIVVEQPPVVVEEPVVEAVVEPVVEVTAEPVAEVVEPVAEPAVEAPVEEIVVTKKKKK